jgi:hypothetical protein
LRASPKRPWRRANFFRRSSFGRSPARIGEQSKTERKQGGAAALRQKAKVADADESWRQHVQQESAQEFVDRLPIRSLGIGLRLAVSPWMIHDGLRCDIYCELLNETTEPVASGPG